jgi:hypothetical protein
MTPLLCLLVDERWFDLKIRVIEPQQSLRDPRLEFRFFVELDDQPLRDLRCIAIDVVLDRNIDLRAATADVTGEPGVGFEGLISSIRSARSEKAPLSVSLEGRSATAALPRAASFLMALAEPSRRQLTRCRCKLERLIS